MITLTLKSEKQCQFAKDYAAKLGITVEVTNRNASWVIVVPSACCPVCTEAWNKAKKVN